LFMLAELDACGSCVADRRCSANVGVVINLALIMCSVPAAPLHYRVNDIAKDMANVRLASQFLFRA
jgi:hypothetical protein